MMCTHAGVVSMDECPYCNSLPELRNVYGLKGYGTASTTIWTRMDATSAAVAAMPAWVKGSPRNIREVSQ